MEEKRPSQETGLTDPLNAEITGLGLSVIPLWGDPGRNDNREMVVIDMHVALSSVALGKGYRLTELRFFEEEVELGRYSGLPDEEILKHALDGSPMEHVRVGSSIQIIGPLYPDIMRPDWQDAQLGENQIVLPATEFLPSITVPRLKDVTKARAILAENPIIIL